MTEETSGQTVLVSMSYNDDLGGWGVGLSCTVEEVTQILGKVIANQFHLCVS